MSRLREINLVAFTKLRTSVSRMHKIFVCSILRTSFPALRDALLKSALVLCYRRVFPRNFFPCTICRRQCVLPQDSPEGFAWNISLLISFIVLSFFFNAKLSPFVRVICYLLSVPSFWMLRLFNVFSLFSFFPKLYTRGILRSFL